MSIPEYIILFFVAYLVGSFPSAFILLKIFSKKDIRREGSGNVGAMNALRSSKRKSIGAAVLALDLLKGALPAWYFTRIYESEFLFLLILVGGLLLGHLYPVWLKFKGGRGLAVTAGALLFINHWLVVIWLSVWLVFYVVLRKHIVASMIATFALPLIVFFTRDNYFSTENLLMILPVCMLIFQRHLERLPDLVEQKRLSIKNGE